MTSIRSITTGAVAGAIAAAALGAVVLTAGTASARTPESGTFTVRAHQGTDTNLDQGKPGFSAGDQDLFTGLLTRKGEHVGRVTGTCTTVSVGATAANQLCEFDLQFGSSQIATSGAVRAGQAGPGTFHLPIVGGTGRYRHARGQIAVTATNGSSFPITVSLR
jgi:allene oxide cyclase-like protein